MQIIAGYLRSTFAQDKPLSLSASICFEQSYSGVDGDSASSTEVYALLSALADLPISQELAVTGSVNQQGDVQPIGGVNQKIEGFFDVCRLKGLTGKQGVLIPSENVEDLMLRDELIEAVAQGQFRIYPVTTVAEGIGLLTGIRAGKREANGKFEEGTVFARVDACLSKMADTMRDYQ
jgi:ATP-dependent Lon protease